MSESLSLIFVSAEVAPYSKVGGLADVSSALPRSLVEHNVTVTVISPWYRKVREHFQSPPPSRFRGEITLGADRIPYAIREISDNGVRFWFVENASFYDRAGIYGATAGTGYPDNNARYFFLQYVVLDLLERQNIISDVVHVNDHHTALLPLMLKQRDMNIPTLLTIHNAMYQGTFSATETGLLDLPERKYFQQQEGNALKTGIRHANRVVTVSPTYRNELLTIPDLAYGLQDDLRLRNESFTGILNGADYDYWNPETDPHLVQNYSVRTLPFKAINKAALIQACHLSGTETTPLFGSVSRQVESKGFHLILAALDDLVAEGFLFVFLGTGEPDIMRALRDYSEKYPASVACVADYDEVLAHRIEAGADFFLMPSRYEPCGLNQIYSLRYGTIPIVHATGGLADTVVDWNGKQGNGFSFQSYDERAFRDAIHRGGAIYGTKDWNSLRRNAMLSDYSWQKSAEKYRSLYAAMRRQHE